jgi:hypothetical protein
MYTVKSTLKAKIKSSDECSKTSWMNYKFSHWFLTSIYAVSIYTVHSLHELTAHIEVYRYLHISMAVIAIYLTVSETSEWPVLLHVWL